MPAFIGLGTAVVSKISPSAGRSVTKTERLGLSHHLHDICPRRCNTSFAGINTPVATVGLAQLQVLLLLIAVAVNELHFHICGLAVLGHSL